MRDPGFVGLVKALFGAVLLGFGTIFQPKPRPDDHWSTSPKVVIVHDADAEEAGEPPLPPPRRLPTDFELLPPR